MKTFSATFLRSSFVWVPLLTGCQAVMQPLPGPVDFQRSPKETATSIGEQTTRTPGIATSRALPGAPVMMSAAGAPAMPPSAPAADDGEPVSIAIDQTPLPTFIQILYGNVLKRPFSLDPAVLTRTDPVTFKSAQPLSKARVYQLAQTLLRNYGLVVQDFEGLVRIAPEGAASGGAVPALTRVTGAADVGGGPRPVYHYVELNVVRVAEVNQWVRQLLGTRVALQDDPNRNAFLISGAQSDVQGAVDLIVSLDQPRMRGRTARRISPANVTAQELATTLTEMMTAQGYAVATNGSNTGAAVLVLPVPSIGSVIVFTSSELVMEQAVRWAQELDQPAQNARTGTGSGLFTYPVRFADAQELARTLAELLGGGVAAAPAPVPTSPMGGGGVATASRPLVSGGGRVVVNNATNTLIIKGSNAEEQQQIRQLLRELDRPAKSAMIEVVVAEMSVGALERLGVQWTVNNLNNITNARSATFGSTGLSISYGNSARQILSAIDALASGNEARILSNPKVLARNGETASIQVGSDVPVVTSQQSTGVISNPIGGPTQSGVLQQIQYRSTGVMLKVRPVINSGNRLDLEVAQEVSSAASTETGVSSSPTISTRRLETKLSLRDGSTVLLGGLISRDNNSSDAGVPLLKDIPGVGALFRSKTQSTTQKEMLVMITPYVINDDFEAEEITEAIHKSFGHWADDLRKARVVREPEHLAPLPAEMPPAAKPELVQPEPLRTSGEAPPAVRSPVSPRPAAAAEAAGDGVVLSRPTAPLPVQTVTPSTAPAAAPAPAGSASAPASPAGSPPGTRPVTDKAVLEELQRHINATKR